MDCSFWGDVQDSTIIYRQKYWRVQNPAEKIINRGVEYRDSQPYLSSFACTCVVLGSVIVHIRLTLRPVFRLHGVCVISKLTYVSLTPFCSKRSMLESMSG